MGRRQINVLFSTRKIKKVKTPKKKKVYSDSQTERKTKKALSLALWALGFLSALVVIGRLITLLTGLFHPLSPELNSHKRYSWQGRDNLNLVIKAGSIAIASLDPQEKTLTVLKLPDETYIDLPKNYGNWAVSSIFDLGQNEHPQIGAVLLKASMSKMLGLPMDGVIVVKNSQGPQQLLENWRKSSLLALTDLNKLQTDLTGAEAIQALQTLSKVRADKVTVLDLAQSSITESKLLPDSSRVLGVDSVRMDLYIRDKMKDFQIANEYAGVVVLNATSHPGLTVDVSRMLTNMGANVIETGNAQSSSAKSSVIANQDSRALVTFRRFAQLFAPGCLTKVCTSTDSSVKESRGQITILLGEDYYQTLNDRSQGF